MMMMLWACWVTCYSISILCQVLANYIEVAPTFSLHISWLRQSPYHIWLNEASSFLMKVEVPTCKRVSTGRVGWLKLLIFDSVFIFWSACSAFAYQAFFFLFFFWNFEILKLLWSGFPPTLGFSQLDFGLNFANSLEWLIPLKGFL